MVVLYQNNFEFGRLKSAVVWTRAKGDSLITKHKQDSHFVNHVLIFFASSLLYSPQLLAPIMGDDLVNPFFNEFQTGGTVVGIRNIVDSISESGHINFLGVTIGSLHSLLWLRIDHFFGLPHWFFYSLSKLIVFQLTLHLISYLTHKICLSLQVFVPYLLVHSMVVVVFVSTSQISQLWSNDPVGNYVLTGYPSAMIGILSIYLFCLYLKKGSSRSLFLSTIVATLGVLYYEINLVLIIVFLVLSISSYLVHKGSVVNLFIEIAKIVSIPLILIPPLVLSKSNNMMNYAGTTIQLGTDGLRSFLVGIFSGIPSAGWPQSFLQLNKFGFDFGFLEFTIVGVFGCLLVSIYIRSKALDLKMPQLPNDINAKGSPRFTKLFTLSIMLYGIFSVVLQTGTQKYQLEIMHIGDTYMFYAQLHIIIVFCLVVILMKNLTLEKKFYKLLALVFVFGAIQMTLNTNLVRAANTYVSASQVVISQFNASSSNEERCLSIENWNRNFWPQEYVSSFLVGLDYSYSKFYGERFCKFQIEGPKK